MPEEKGNDEGESNKNSKGKSNHKPSRNRRKRGGRNSNREKKKKGVRGPPPVFPLKVLIRNIGSASDVGTAADLAEKLIRPLLRHANARLSLDTCGMVGGCNSIESIKLVLDEPALKDLVDGDTAARKIREDWEQIQKEEEREDTNGDRKDEPSQAVEGSSEANKTEDNKEYTQTNTNESMTLPELTDTSVLTKVMYMVPPRQTKRHGEKPGCVYLVLTAPPIPPREAPAGDKPTGQGDTGENPTTSSLSPTRVDYSRDGARRRWMLQQALDALVQITSEDATRSSNSTTTATTGSGKSRNSSQNQQQHIPIYFNGTASEATSIKIWKPRGKGRDRLEGTLEGSADYIDFWKRMEKDKEELKARPKPPPGGTTLAILSSSTTTAGTSTPAPDTPVSALVLHVQKHKAEQKKRKQQKHQSKKGKKSGKVDPTEGNGKKQQQKKRKGAGGRGGGGRKPASGKPAQG